MIFLGIILIILGFVIIIFGDKSAVNEGGIILQLFSYKNKWQVKFVKWAVGLLSIWFGMAMISSKGAF
jgi:hypothetical protein